MFDAVTDWATEALDAFCAKKMGEQLRNILRHFARQVQPSVQWTILTFIAAEK